MDALIRDQLQLQIDAIKRDCPAPLAPPTAPSIDDLALVEMEDEHVLREPFGRWLLAQRDRGDWIDQLANAARADRGFPRSGTPEEVGKRLQALGADPDAFEQLEDAERMWASA